MATYDQIQEWVRSRHGWTPKPSCVAHCKELAGLPVRRAPTDEQGSRPRCRHDAVEHPAPAGLRGRGGRASRDVVWQLWPAASTEPVPWGLSPLGEDE